MIPLNLHLIIKIITKLVQKEEEITATTKCKN